MLVDVPFRPLHRPGKTCYDDRTAESIEQIASTDLSDVFSELYAIEADLRSG